MDLAEQNQKLECLIDWIEEQQAMMKQFPVYTLPEIDLDEEWDDDDGIYY